MRKKPTDEEIATFLCDIAEKIKSDIDFDFRVAQGQMWIAEKDLVVTFTAEQKQLYQHFCQKRDEFYNIAQELYVKRF